jgi:hypothetical protein
LFYTENSFLTVLKTILRILETSESGLSWFEAFLQIVWKK